MKKKTIIKSSLCILFVIAIGFMFKLNSNAKPKYKITNQTSPSLTECSHSIKKKIILNPSANKDGIQKEYCEKCKYVKYTKYICKHEHETQIVLKKATCIEAGTQETKCLDCNKVLETTIINKTGHTFPAWTENATNMMFRTCQNCGIKEYKKLQKNDSISSNSTIQETQNSSSMKNNSIFIPGTGINNSFTITTLTQASVNNNDLTYTYAYEAGLGENDPFILGHNYGTMKFLHNTNVGQNIYVSLNGMIETYQVIISELAQATDDQTDIIGLSSNYSIFHNFGTKTLHLYTCDNRVSNGRWMVLAKKI